MNIFKKIKLATTSTETIIREIHNEFDGATDKLLAEAKEILSKRVNVDKAVRLKQLGFTNSTPVKERESVISEQEKKMELSKLIEYYTTHYPNYKFITKEVVEKICKKYGLYCGGVSNYIGDVPDKNIKEMESFKLRQEDMSEYYPHRNSYHRQLHISQMGIAMRSMQDQRFNSMLGQSNYAAERYSEVSKPSDDLWDVKEYYKAEFSICAPEKDFNTYMMSKSGVFLIPDPIVLQPVNGGYLIVTKWGLEGEDKELTNEKMN